MRAPYGLNIIDNCATCPVREDHLFCNLSLPALQKLNEIKSTALYPKSAMLFAVNFCRNVALLLLISPGMTTSAGPRLFLFA